MKSFALFSLLILCTTLSAVVLTPSARDAVRHAGADLWLDINLVMSSRIDPLELRSEVAGLDIQIARQEVIRRLKDHATATQSDLLSQLREYEKRGLVRDTRSLWLVNAISFTCRPEVVRELETRDDIARIDLDEKELLIDPDSWADSRPASPGREITWNVLNVRADDAWNEGITGQGVTVAVIDTGVNYNHNDLSDHVWNHPGYPYHGYDFVNGDNNPMDDHGHGTHCAGTVAGDGTSGSQTGIAPNATIMCLKVLDNSGNGQESGVWNSIQFAFDNGADVISMSLGWPHSSNPDRASWRAAMDNIMTGGMVACVAAGNEGDDQDQYPRPDNVRTPGDVPPPWLHPDQTLAGGTSAVVCVGASNNQDGPGYFTSLGPVSWSGITGYNDYSLSGGNMGLIRPDIVAPGVGIKSLNYSSNTGYVDGWNGTSMATPCVAGVVALMQERAGNALTPEEVCRILEYNSEVLTREKSNHTGAGRVDALDAVRAVARAGQTPSSASLPIPTDGATGTTAPPWIDWNSGDDATSYTFYLGTDNPPTNIVNALSLEDSRYRPSTTLEAATQYFWQVESVNSHGSTLSPVWNFTTGGAPDEDFNTGDFNAFGWTHGGASNWTIDTVDPYSGVYCIRSGTVDDNQSSELSLSMTTSSAGNISFAVKVSSEASYDFLRFRIDGAEQDNWSGFSDWSMVSFPVSAGTHTFSWVYDTDGSMEDREDCAWIDAITFPPHAPPEPELSVNPLSLDFGNVAVGSTGQENFTITNTGTGTLEGTITTPANFTVAQTRGASIQFTRNQISYAVGQGVTATFMLDFTPPAAQTYSGQVTVTSNDADTPQQQIAVTGTGTPPAQISVSPDALEAWLEPDTSGQQALTIGNQGTADLVFTIDIDEPDRDSGGPDSFGYTWLDNTEPDGPTYGWIDATGGTQLTFPGNDAAPPSISLPFNFPFYGTEYAQMVVNPNGWIGFGPDQSTWSNTGLPDPGAPSPAIFPFWDDLNPNNQNPGSDPAGDVYVLAGADMTVVSWEGVIHWTDSYGTFTFQAILYPNGEILLQYNDMGDTTVSTVGIQNTGGTDGIEVLFNGTGTAITDGMAILITPPVPQWLSADLWQGTVLSNQTMDVTFTADATGLDIGDWNKVIRVASNDPAQPLVEVPFTLHVTDNPQLAAPANVQIEIIAANVRVSWDAVPGATQYRVWLSTTPTGTFQPVGTTANAFYTLNNAATMGQLYLYVTSMNE